LLKYWKKDLSFIKKNCRLYNLKYLRFYWKNLQVKKPVFKPCFEEATKPILFL